MIYFYLLLLHFSEVQYHFFFIKSTSSSSSLKVQSVNQSVANFVFNSLSSKITLFHSTTNASKRFFDIYSKWYENFFFLFRRQPTYPRHTQTHRLTKSSKITLMSSSMLILVKIIIGSLHKRLLTKNKIPLCILTYDKLPIKFKMYKI